MESLLVHKFLTVEEADLAMTELNKYYNLPILPNYGIDPTITKFDNQSYFFHPDGFYYMPYNEKWTFILNTPELIDLPEIFKNT